MQLRSSKNEKDMSQQHPTAVKQVTREVQYDREREEPERNWAWPQRRDQVGGAPG